MQNIQLNFDQLRQSGVDEAHRIVHTIAASAPAALRAPVNIAKERIAAAETALRANFGGFDASLSSAEARKRLVNRYKELFGLLDVRGRGCVPIDDLEDCFGAAELFEARTEIGQLAYDADKDGNGALNIDEFIEVLDQIAEYTNEMQGLRTRIDNEGSFFFGADGATMTLRQVIFRTFDDPMFSGFAKLIAGTLLTAILLAVLVFVLQTEPTLSSNGGLFALLEGFCLTTFLVDYVVRVLTCDSYRGFFFSVSNTVDFLTIVPYFLDGVNEAFHPTGQYGAAVQIFRVFRIFRIFKVMKYIPYVSLMTASMKASAAPLGMAFLILMIGILLLAMTAFYAERGNWDDDAGLWINDAGEPAPMQSVGDAVYWCIVTLTTVGYGEVLPVMPLGKFVGSLCALSGCMIISFPIAIYTDEFSKQYSDYEKKKALYAELGTSNLLFRLLKARYEQLAKPDYPRFAVKRDIRSYRAICVPRNIQLMRFLRELMIAHAKGPEDLTPVMILPQQRRSRAVQQALEASPAAMISGSPFRIPNEDQAVGNFGEIWASEILAQQAPRARAWSVGAEDYTYEILGQPNAGAAASLPLVDDPLQRKIYERIIKRAEGELLPNVRTENAVAAATVRDPGELPSGSSHATDGAPQQNAHARLAKGEELFSSLLALAKRALETRRLATLSDRDQSERQPWTDLKLAPDSFSYMDLTLDSDVEKAILELVSDFRKRLWAEIRSLEAKFRDDIVMELARRWQVWMAMPADYVHDIAFDFVFRKKELNAALRFSRSSVAVGPVVPSEEVMEDPDAPSLRRSQPDIGGKADKAGAAVEVHRILGQLGSTVRSHLPSGMQPESDQLNYQARIASRYADVLGVDVPALRPVSSVALQAAELHPADSEAAFNAFQHIAVATDTQKITSGTNDPYVSTAFGRSTLPRNLPTIASSWTSGTASVSGAPGLTAAIVAETVAQRPPGFDASEFPDRVT